MADDIEKVYSDYKTAPNPNTLHSVVKALEPTISYSLAAVNAAQDPLVRGKAALYAADAVEKFDPAAGTKLTTFVSSHLRQLNRTARQSRSPVKIPERVQIESFKLKQARAKYADEHGREPDMLELADYTGVPFKHLEKLNRYQYAIPSESQIENIPSEGPDWDKEALEYIYNDADHTDRRILEMKTGHGGFPVLAPKDIALTLNLTPTQLTRRSIRLTNRINQLRESLEKI